MNKLNIFLGVLARLSSTQPALPIVEIIQHSGEIKVRRAGKTEFASLNSYQLAWADDEESETEWVKPVHFAILANNTSPLTGLPIIHLYDSYDNRPNIMILRAVTENQYLCKDPYFKLYNESKILIVEDAKKKQYLTVNEWKSKKGLI